MYRELLIYPESLKGQPVFPDTARSLVAKACDATDVNPEIFARQPDGKTVQRVFGHTASGEGYGAVPSICFNGGKGFIRLYGLGKRGRDLLSSEAAPIATAISRLLNNTPYRFDIRDGSCDITPERPGAYRIHNLVVAKKRYQFADIAEKGLPSLEAMTPLIVKAIHRGLIGQAMALDEETGSQLAFRIPSEEMLGIQIFEGKPVFTPLKNGARACALGVHGLEFTMNLHLEGPWFAGHLRSRGFGQINRRILR